MSQSVTQRMPFEEFEQRLLDFVRGNWEGRTNEDISRAYDAVVEAALVTGWTQQELWDESDRRFKAEMERFIAEMES